MKIKAKLQSSTAIVMASVLAIGAVLLMSSWIFDNAAEKASRANAITQEIFELNALTYEYLLHKTERAQIQWRSKYDSIANALTQQQEMFQAPDEHVVLEEIHQNHQAIKDVFSRLVAAREIHPGYGEQKAASIGFITELEERLVAQILVRAQAMIVAASRLSQSSLEHQARVRQRAESITLALIAILIIVTASSSFLIYRSVVPPLSRLHEGTDLIARGHWDHRIAVQSRDEIGHVAQSFNDMAAKLQTSYVELENRVHARTAELGSALKEREVLLQEIHHRVKNNLQVISSLINLQVRKLDDGASRAALAECQTRVQAIALIHEKLYQSADYARIPFPEYVRSLAANVFHATGVSPQGIVLDLAIEDITLAVDQAIPCGLILNELITNALKHAFPNDRAGTLRVEFTRVASTQIALVVQDDGIGMPPDTDIHRSASLGMQLIVTLASQLAGRVDVTGSGGTRVAVMFPFEG